MSQLYCTNSDSVDKIDFCSNISLIGFIIHFLCRTKAHSKCLALMRRWQCLTFFCVKSAKRNDPHNDEMMNIRHISMIMMMMNTGPAFLQRRKRSHDERKRCRAEWITDSKPMEIRQPKTTVFLGVFVERILENTILCRFRCHARPWKRFSRVDDGAKYRSCNDNQLIMYRLPEIWDRGMYCEKYIHRAILEESHLDKRSFSNALQPCVCSKELGT